MGVSGAKKMGVSGGENNGGFEGQKIGGPASYHITYKKQTTFF